MLTTHLPSPIPTAGSLVQEAEWEKRRNFARNTTWHTYVFVIFANLYYERADGRQSSNGEWPSASLRAEQGKNVQPCGNGRGFIVHARSGISCVVRASGRYTWRGHTTEAFNTNIPLEPEGTSTVETTKMPAGSVKREEQAEVKSANCRICTVGVSMSPFPPAVEIKLSALTFDPLGSFASRKRIESLAASTRSGISFTRPSSKSGVEDRKHASKLARRKTRGHLCRTKL